MMVDEPEDRRKRPKGQSSAGGVDLSHSVTLCLALALAAVCAGGAMAQPGAQAAPGKVAAELGAPNALTTLLPHQRGRSLCYISRGAPVSYLLEDIPARKKPRHLT